MPCDTNEMKSQLLWGYPLVSNTLFFIFVSFLNSNKKHPSRCSGVLSKFFFFEPLTQH